MTDLLLFAADHVVTVVWFKATCLAALLVLALAALGRSSAAIHAVVAIASLGALLVLAGLQHVAPPWGPAILDFPVFLFRHTGVDLAHRLTLGRMPAAVAAAPAAQLPLATWIGAVWLSGAAALIARLVWQTRRLAAIAAGGEPVAAPRASGVTVVRSVDVSAPLTFGWRRPVILLPAAAADWPADRLGSVLAHELAHVRRRDYPALLVLEVVRALYWINPLVWIAARRARALLELACDDAVLRAGVPALDYAGHLVDLAAPGRRLTLRGGLAMARPSLIRVRLQAILDGRRDRRPATALAIAAAALSTLIVTAAVASAGVWACAETPAGPVLEAVDGPAAG